MLNHHWKSSNGDLIISALIGLAGACSNNPKTDKTDLLVVKALAFPLNHPEANDNMLQSLIQEIHDEKYVLSPGCAQCAFPCGNTSDYDMSKIYHADETIRSIKRQILDGLQHIAAHLYRCRQFGDILPFFYQALCQVSYDLDQDTLFQLLEKTKTIALVTAHQDLQ